MSRYISNRRILLRQDASVWIGWPPLEVLESQTWSYSSAETQCFQCSFLSIDIKKMSLHTIALNRYRGTGTGTVRTRNGKECGGVHRNGPLRDAQNKEFPPSVLQKNQLQRGIVSVFTCTPQWSNDLLYFKPFLNSFNTSTTRTHDLWQRTSQLLTSFNMKCSKPSLMDYIPNSCSWVLFSLKGPSRI